MNAPLTLEDLHLSPKSARVARRVIAAQDQPGQGWCCGIALRHPKVGGHGMTMRMTEVSRAIGAAFGMDPMKAVERQWCECVMRCRHRLDHGGEKVLAYRLSPELWGRIVVGEARGRDAA